jgi:hypothetical protein
MRLAIGGALFGAASLLGGGLAAGCEEQRLDEEQREHYEEALEPEEEREEAPIDELGPDQRLGQEGLVGGAQPREPEGAEAPEPTSGGGEAHGAEER